MASRRRVPSRSFRVGGPFPRWWVALLPLVALSGLAAPSQAPAQERSWGVDSMVVRLEVREDRSYRVEERIAFRFEGGTFSRGFRSIPLGRIGRVQGVRVESPDTEILEPTNRRRGGEQVIEWGFPDRSEPALFVIRYEVPGALRATDTENLIDWDAVGDAWEAPIERVRVEVAWPELGLEAAEIATEPAEHAALEASEEGWTATFRPGGLDARTPYRILIRFPKRIEGPPPPEPRSAAEVLLVLGLALAGLLPGFVILIASGAPRVRARAGSDAAPPLPLHEAAMIGWGRMYWSVRTFPALLVDLAGRGHVVLRRERRPEEDGSHDPDEDAPEVLRVERAGARDPLTDVEARFLDELARHDSFEAFVKEAGTFRRRLRRELWRELIRRGLVDDLAARSNRLLFTAVLLTAVTLALAFVVPGPATPAVAAFGFAGAVGLVVGALRRWRLSGEGARLRSQIRARADAVRKEIERERGRDPRRAGELLLRHLPWCLLDPRVTPGWLRRIQKALEKRGEDLDLPPWLRSAVGEVDEDELAAVLTVAYLVTLAQPGQASAAAGAGGVSAVGVGATGGFGGGGGGVS